MSNTAFTKSLPRDARLVALILAGAGADDAEPAVVAMLLEFAHRWTSDILQDAIVYREHSATKVSATGSLPTLDDIRLAIRGRVEQSSGAGLSREQLTNLSLALNKQPLPPIEGSLSSIRLPPPIDRLTAINFDYVPKSKPSPTAMSPEDQDQDQEMRSETAENHSDEGDGEGEEGEDEGE